jgi:predicted flap endonuclease-1-like 5' DNA nuclease
MLEIASQMILCLLLAALIGFIIGYLFGRSSCSPDVQCGSGGNTHDDTADHDEEVCSEENDTTVAGQAPQLLDAPRNGQKDNLTRIKGIGVKIEETLNEKGIYHFDQIANWTDEEIKWVDANVAFPGRVKRENWVEQAKTLAAGEETEFSKRVDAGEVSTSKKA